MKQCKIRDLENNVVHGAILMDNGDAICGCCGGILELYDVGCTWEIVEEYSNWVNLDEEICGELLNER